MARFRPRREHSIKETRVANPKVLKTDFFLFWNGRFNVDRAWRVVRHWFTQRQDHCVREARGPVQGGEVPVELFKQRVVLHIAPRERSPFNWKFHQRLRSDEIIKC